MSILCLLDTLAISTKILAKNFAPSLIVSINTRRTIMSVEILKRKRGGLIFQSRDYAVVKRRAAEAVWVAESLPPLRLILN